MRRQRNIVIASLVFLALILMTILFARFDVTRYRSSIQSQMEQQLNRKVTLGDMKLRLFPLRVYVKDPVIWEDPNFRRDGAFIKADSMIMSIRLLPLLTKSLELDAVDWQRPQVALVKNGQGEWNVSSLGFPKVKSLTVHDGRVAVTKLPEKESPAIYDHVDFAVRDWEKSFSIDAVAHVANQSDEGFRLQGRGGPLSRVNVLSTPFDGMLSLNKVPISSLKNIFETAALSNAGGIASGKTAIKTENGKMSAVGDLKLDKLSLHDVDLGYPITAQYTLVEDPKTGLIEIRSANLDLGGTSVSVSGSVNLQSAPVELSLNVHSSSGSAAQLARLASMMGVGVGPDTTVTGQLTGDVQIRGSVRTPMLNGAISARNLRLSGKEFPQPVQINSMDLTITPKEIRSNEFEVRSGNTTAVTRVAFTQYMSRSPFINFAVRSTNAALMDVRSIARAYGAKGLARIEGSGTLNLNLYAQGSLQAIRSSEIVRLLSGNASLNLSNVHITGTDFSRAAFPKIGQPTNIERVTGRFALNRGVATTNDLRVMLNIGNVAASGMVNLVDETLYLRATAVLTAAASQHVIGSGLQGIMASMMLNPRGELVVPGIITGTFDHPKFEPDKQQLALSRLRGIFPTTENPAGLLGTLLGRAGVDKPSTESVLPRHLNPIHELGKIFGKLPGAKRK